MIQLNLGDVTVHRLLEQEGPSFEPTFFFPDATMDGFEEQMDWLAPHFWDVKANTYIRSIQSYLIRTSHHWILVDACVGNDKERPSTPGWHGLKSSWLGQLARIGVHPEEIDFVLCTHLHADHVGWNTQLVDNRWVPTFPNAKYIVHKKEYQHWVKHGDGMEGPGSADGCFEDSVLPVMEAGIMELVGDDFGIDDHINLNPTPGHSPGHVCINVRARDGQVIVSGDVLHHPIQVAYPEWNSRFCMDAAQSRATRKRFVERHVDTETIILAAHFATPTAGRIVSNGARCRFQI